jgi:hypothetical protein
MNKQQHYVPPGIEIHRVIMEAAIAQTPTSVKKFTIEAQPWSDGGEYTWGDQSSTGEGNAYVAW